MTSSGYLIPTDLHLQAHFQLVRVFRESVQYARFYKLPFNVVSICIRENPSRPSTVTNTLTGECVTFRENDIHFVPLDTPSFYRYTYDNEHLCIFFTLELFPGADVFTGMPGRMVVNNPALRQEAQDIFAQENPVKRLMACQEFALRIALPHWPEHYQFDLAGKQAFAPLMAYIRAHTQAQLSVSELARVQGESEGYFTRHFTATMGLTPKQFLQRELFAKAARLLLRPGMGVKNTAAELGFSSEFYFSKFFKRFAGIAPNDYRKNAAPQEKVRK